jgi:uncharacterized protein (TIGR04376 family)
MGLFEDLSRFLETRLEEFLKNNPHLELQALEESLREQEEETLRLMAELKQREGQVKQEILTTAQEVQRWHERVEKAKVAGRLDLAQLAQEREAALLWEGNQRWGQMQLVQERLRQTHDLQSKIKARRQEVRSKAAQAEAARTQADQRWASAGWAQDASPYSSRQPDPLEEKFRRWEADSELDQMKRNLDP